MSAADLGKALRVISTDVDRARIDISHAGDGGDKLTANQLRKIASDIYQAGELIRCLARMVEGKSLYQAFGAPGDFGYDTPIGEALARHYSEVQS